MASLSFQDHEVSIEFSPHPEREIGLILRFSRPVSALLIKELSNLIHEPTTELKLNLTQGWTVYFKLRDGESRQYLSHPETEQWVATCALNQNHLESLIQNLGQEPMAAFDLSALAPIQGLSNLEVRWERRT